MRRLLAAFLMLALCAAGARAGDPDGAFRRWLAHDLWPAAHGAGISREVFNRAFAGVRVNPKLPDLILPGQSRIPKRQRQAEFGAPARYFNERSLAALAARGRALLGRHKRLFARIAARYGVPGRIILGIWARESNYGAARIPYNAFSILGTQAFLGRRRELFRRELLAALTIVQKGYAPAKALKASWAGALGQPQMMPSFYLKYAVDFDGDGRRDIWRSIPDITASIASHLAAHGWKRGLDWGFEVTVPASVSCTLEGPDQGKSFARWAAMGVRRAGGGPFPKGYVRRRGYLLMPAGRFGPAFIVTDNFYVLKAYNMSDLYALFVGHLGDRIRWNARSFRAVWGDVGHLPRSDVAAMQRRLEALGHDVGGADGLPGFKTRRYIGRWQAAHGLKPRCFPTQRLKALLK